MLFPTYLFRKSYIYMFFHFSIHNFTLAGRRLAELEMQLLLSRVRFLTTKSTFDHEICYTQYNYDSNIMLFLIQVIQKYDVRCLNETCPEEVASLVVFPKDPIRIKLQSRDRQA